MERSGKRTGSRTPTFVSEFPLRLTRRDLRMVETRLEIGRQLYNATLRDAVRRVQRIQQDLRWARARKMPAARKVQRKRRARLFRRVRQHHDFSDYALQRTACVHFRRSRWMCDHLGSHEVQKLGTRAYLAAEKLLQRQARRVRFKGRRQFDTLEGKSNHTGIRWRSDHVEWNGLILEAIIHKRDSVLQYSLTHTVKYVRVVRRRVRGRSRLYAQLVLRGRPYRKPQHTMAKGHVGLDVGPSTVAIVGQDEAILTSLCEPVVRQHRSIQVLQRQIERQRRAANPKNYFADGRAKPRSNRWIISRRQRRNLDRLAEFHRREKAHRKTLHGQLVNRMLRMGIIIHYEDSSRRALQRCYGRSVSVRAPGLFLAISRRKAESAGGRIVEIPARSAKLSQTCHRCGAIQKKPLSQRVHQCGCGVIAQRDLYSAFLARHTDADGVLHAGRAKKAWPGAEPLLRAAWRQALQPASGRLQPSTFGTLPGSRSQSGSLAKRGIANVEAHDQ